MSTTFAARLNRLFDVVYPPGRGPHTSAEVIAALKADLVPSGRYFPTSAGAVFPLCATLHGQHEN